MPMSNPGHIAPVLHFLTGLAPNSLLDVGVGLGTYGFLARQFLDIGQARLDPTDWQIRIDGIEIFEPYRNPVWDYYYDTIAVCDIRERVHTLGSYDVILCNDVLEHFPREEARTLITALLGRCRVLIATTPFADFPQGAWCGNNAETHHSLLTKDDFPASTHVHRTGVTSFYVSWSDPDSADKIARLGRSLPRIVYPGETVPARVRAYLGRLSRSVGR